MQTHENTNFYRSNTWTTMLLGFSTFLSGTASAQEPPQKQGKIDTITIFKQGNHKETSTIIDHKSALAPTIPALKTTKTREAHNNQIDPINSPDRTLVGIADLSDFITDLRKAQPKSYGFIEFTKNEHSGLAPKVAYLWIANSEPSQSGQEHPMQRIKILLSPDSDFSPEQQIKLGEFLVSGKNLADARELQDWLKALERKELDSKAFQSLAERFGWAALISSVTILAICAALPKKNNRDPFAEHPKRENFSKGHIAELVAWGALIIGGTGLYYSYKNHDFPKPGETVQQPPMMLADAKHLLDNMPFSKALILQDAPNSVTGVMIIRSSEGAVFTQSVVFSKKEWAELQKAKDPEFSGISGERVAKLKEFLPPERNSDSRFSVMHFLSVLSGTLGLFGTCAVFLKTRGGYGLGEIFGKVVAHSRIEESQVETQNMPDHKSFSRKIREDRSFEHVQRVTNYFKSWEPLGREETGLDLCYAGFKILETEEMVTTGTSFPHLKQLHESICNSLKLDKSKEAIAFRWQLTDRDDPKLYPIIARSLAGIDSLEAHVMRLELIKRGADLGDIFRGHGRM